MASRGGSLLASTEAKDVVRLWIKKGIVPTSREPGRSRGPLWLHIDATAEKQLHELATRSPAFQRRKKPTTLE